MERRQQERDALLAQLVTLMKGDERFVAAWLWGSLGRGQGDAWSDLDLWIVVEDAHYPEISSGFVAFLAPLSPLFVMEQRVNGPPGGTAFNVAVMGVETGAQNVDFDIFPRSLAVIGSDTQVLFDHVDLPRSTAPQVTGGNADVVRTSTEQLIQETRFYFLMWLVCAKYVARDPHGERMGLFSYVLGAQRNIHGCLDMTGDSPSSEAPISRSPVEKAALLRTSLADMEICLPSVRALAYRDGISCEISDDVFAASRLFLDTVLFAVQERNESSANSEA